MVQVSVVLPHVIGADTVEGGIERAAEAGVDAVEFFNAPEVDAAAVREAAAEHGVDIAATAAFGETPGIDEASPAIVDPDSFEQSVADLERSIDAAAEVGARNLVATVGQARDDLDPFAQHETLVEVLRAVAPAAEEAGVTVVPETLNRRVDHPGYFLAASHEGYKIVQAVDSPHVELLYDVYHQQVTEGNVIQNLRNNIEYVGHMHLADVPGRHEPGTGELNYSAIFRALDDIGYDGYIGCEFGATGDPFEAVRDVVELADEV